MTKVVLIYAESRKSRIDGRRGRQQLKVLRCHADKPRVRDHVVRTNDLRSQTAEVNVVVVNDVLGIVELLVDLQSSSTTIAWPYTSGTVRCTYPLSKVHGGVCSPGAR